MKPTLKMPPYKYKGQTFSLKWALELMKQEGAQRVTKRTMRTACRRKAVA